MTPYLVWIPGIHDVPGAPRIFEPVMAEDFGAAAEYAAGRYGLSAVPPGTVEWLEIEVVPQPRYDHARDVWL